MIIVRVEMHSAITGKITELARMHIANTGGKSTHGDYHAETLRGRSAFDLDRGTPQRSCDLQRYPRLSLHVWNLVARALIAMNYK